MRKVYGLKEKKEFEKVGRGKERRIEMDKEGERKEKEKMKELLWIKRMIVMSKKEKWVWKE